MLKFEMIAKIIAKYLISRWFLSVKLTKPILSKISKMEIINSPLNTKTISVTYLNFV